MSKQVWNRRNILFVLHESESVGAATIKKLNELGKLDECPYYTASDWQRIDKIGPKRTAALLRAFTSDFFEQRQRLYEKTGVTWLTIEDEAYPELLRQVSDPPAVIYAQGRLELLQYPAYAIVGTRVPTAYGRSAARTIAERLSECGVTVVSGFARGIDACAHEGGLRGAGSTIAVLGTPIGTIYPPQHASLYREIAKRGVILSQFPHGTPSAPGLFPLRNRIIAAMTYGTIVVEAAEQSGSLITAELAGGYERTVYAVPGMMGSPKSEGSNKLIRAKQATLLHSPDDVLADLWALTADGERRRRLSARVRAAADDLTSEEHRIIRALRDHAMTADELAAETGLPFGHLHALLINLTIKRKIEQHPGSIYTVY